MLYSPSIHSRFNSSCSPCKPKCLKDSWKCPPPCDFNSLIDRMSEFPFRKHVECLSRLQLEQLLKWAERYRIWHIGDSDLSVILYALHLLAIGEFHELEYTSYLGVQGSRQIERSRRMRSKGDSFALSAWGLHYLELLDGAVNTVVVGA